MAIRAILAVLDHGTLRPQSRATGHLAVGLFGTDGAVFEADGIPSAGSGQARTWSSSFLGRCGMRISQILDLLKERDCDTMSISSEKRRTSRY